MHRYHCLQSCSVWMRCWPCCAGCALGQAVGTLDVQDFGAVRLIPVLPIRGFEC